MQSFTVKNEAGKSFEVDEDKAHEAEADGYLPVVSNGKQEHRVSFKDMSLAEADGFKPLQATPSSNAQPTEAPQDVSNPMDMVGGLLKGDFNQFKKGLPSESAVSAGVRHFAQGAGAGWLDELSGALEAGGRAVGITGAGDDFGNQGVATPDFNIKDNYVLGRDKKRDMLAKEATEHPYISTGAELAGMTAGPGRFMKSLPTTSALSGLTTLGASEADLTKGEYLDAAKDAAIGAGVGAVTQAIVPAIKATGRLANGLTDKFAESATNTPRGILAGKGGQLVDEGVINALDSGKNIAQNAANVTRSTQNAIIDTTLNSTSTFTKDQVKQALLNEVAQQSPGTTFRAGETAESIVNEILSHQGETPFTLSDIGGYISTLRNTTPGAEPVVKGLKGLFTSATPELESTIGTTLAPTLRKQSDLLNTLDVVQNSIKKAPVAEPFGIKDVAKTAIRTAVGGSLGGIYGGIGGLASGLAKGRGASTGAVVSNSISKMISNPTPKLTQYLSNNPSIAGMLKSLTSVTPAIAAARMFVLQQKHPELQEALKEE